MGIRPTFYKLVGIDDAKKNDPRYTPVDKEWLEEILNFREMTRDEMWRDNDLFDDWEQAEKIPGISKWLTDCIYNPTFSREYFEGNVIGYIVEKGRHDDPFIRALAALDEKYLTTGHERIPLLDPEKHKLRITRKYYSYTEEDIANNMFVSGVFESMPSMSRMYWDKAQHYLKLVGWNVPKTDLRYLLVWHWG